MAERQQQQHQQQQTGDYFGTFLDKVKQTESSSEEVNDNMRSLLTTLLPGPQEIWSLQKKMALAFPVFTSELEAARTSGYVELQEESGTEKVALTAAGTELAARLQSK